jgi:hypothetical protein
MIPRALQRKIIAKLLPCISNFKMNKYIKMDLQQMYRSPQSKKIPMIMWINCLFDSHARVQLPASVWCYQELSSLYSTVRTIIRLALLYIPWNHLQKWNQKDNYWQRRGCKKVELEAILIWPQSRHCKLEQIVLISLVCLCPFIPKYCSLFSCQNVASCKFVGKDRLK